MSELAFSGACERNKDPILAVLREVLAERRRVLEIGAGTGQHAVYFSAAMPWLRWLATDQAVYLPDLERRIRLEGPANCSPPVELDVRSRPWPVSPVDAVFSANTLHIMAWPEVEQFFQGVGEVLEGAGSLCVYGPFRYNGEFTTPSNAAFDQSLRLRDPASGIRDFEAVNELAQRQGLRLRCDHAMPANNQLLIWDRS